MSVGKPVKLVSKKKYPLPQVGDMTSEVREKNGSNFFSKYYPPRTPSPPQKKTTFIDTFTK